MDPPYRAIITDVEVPLQTGLSDQTMAALPDQAAEPRARRARAERRAQRGPRAAAPADGRDRAGAASPPAPTSPTCCWPAPPGAAARWPCGCRSAPAAGRCWRQLLVESCTLALARRPGRAAGVAVDAERHRRAAAAGGGVAVIPDGIDGTVLLYALGLSLATGIVFGLYPALHSTRPDLVGVLKGHSGQPSGARAASRFRDRARHQPDRAVDGPAGRGRASSPRASTTSAASSSVWPPIASSPSRWRRR